PFIRFQIVFQQIRMPVHAPHFEIIGARPFWFALDLVPTVEDFLHLDSLFFPDEATRRFVGLGSGVTFDLNWDELHLRVFNRIEHKEHTEFLIFVSAISAFLVVKFPPLSAFSLYRLDFLWPFLRHTLPGHTQSL